MLRSFLRLMKHVTSSPAFRLTSIAPVSSRNWIACRRIKSPSPLPSTGHAENIIEAPARARTVSSVSRLGWRPTTSARAKSIRYAKNPIATTNLKPDSRYDVRTRPSTPKSSSAR